MAGFEDLIRDTLAKQGEPTHANRARVYASARSALERMIAKSDDPDAAQVQRENLEAAIERIEDEHTARLSSAAPVDLSSTPEPEPAPEPASAPTPPAPPPTVAVAPVVPVATPVPPAEAKPTNAPSAETRRKPQSRSEAKRTAKLLDDRPKGRPLVKLFLWLVILAGLLVAGWWLWANGEAFVADLEPVAPQVEAKQAGGEEAWLTAFAAEANIDAVTTGEAASSQVVREGRRTWLRLASSADPDDGANGQVRVRVPPGIMQTLSGGRATFEATVRTSPGTQPHPFSVGCEFEAGRCNRNRFEAGLTEQPFLFTAELGGSEQAGTLVFDTDLDGLGRAIDLGSIRVSR